MNSGISDLYQFYIYPLMEKDAETFDETFNETYDKNEELFGHPYQELQDHFKQMEKRGSILDVGSGQGRDSLFLASIGFNVTAIDISEVGMDQMLSKAKDLDLDIEGIAGDALTVDIEKKFDIILFDMLLHSFDEMDQIKLLEKYSMNLKTDGKLCIVYPDDMKKDHFLDLLQRINDDWKVLHEKTIYDVPKIEGMEDDEEFTFKLLILRRK